MRNKSNRYYLVLEVPLKRWRKPRGNEERDTTNSSALHALLWLRFGRSNEKRRSGGKTFYMLILFSILIVILSKDVLSQTCVNRKCVFCIFGLYSAEQYDAQIFGQRVLLRLLEKEVLVSWHLRKIKVSLSIDVRRMPLLMSSLLKEERRNNVEPKLKRKKRNVR